MTTIKESQTIEFKQLWKDEYLKTICAFANSEGGDFYIGIADDSTAVGIDGIDILLEVLQKKINNRLGLLIDIVCEVTFYKTTQNIPSRI